MWNSKIWHKWTYLHNKNRFTDVEIRLVFDKGGGGGEGMDRELGLVNKLLYVEWINKVLLYSTGHYIKYPGINQNGKEYKKRMYICV